MRQLVFDPLELEHTTYHPEPEKTAATEFGNRIEQGMTENLGLSFTNWRETTKAIRGSCDDGNEFYYSAGPQAMPGSSRPLRIQRSWQEST